MKKLVCRNGNKKFEGDVYLADNFFTRLVGLQFKSNIDYGILFIPGGSIHTFWMREPIDVVFMSKENEVVRIYKSLKPWRVTKPIWKAKKVLELPEGALDSFQVAPGDCLEFDYV